MGTVAAYAGPATTTAVAADTAVAATSIRKVRYIIAPPISTTIKIDGGRCGGPLSPGRPTRTLSDGDGDEETGERVVRPDPGGAADLNELVARPRRARRGHPTQDRPWPGL